MRPKAADGPICSHRTKATRPLADLSDCRAEVGNGRRLNTPYTPDHKPEVTSLPQSSDITYEHDATTGKLSTITTPEALYTFIHDDDGGPDDTGQLQSVSIDPTAVGLATNTLTYTYDGDLLTGEASSGDVNGSVTWGYDDQLRVDAETAAGDTVAYGYDSQGRMDSMGAMTATYVPTTGQLDTTTLSGVLATYSYDPFGDLEGILYEDGATAVYEVTYTRDSYGRIETKTETHSGSTNLRCYEYDDADRLADVYDAADSLGCTGTNLESYSYDANGNRSAVTNSAGAIGAGGIVTDNQDRLLTHGDWTYTYNEDGQMTSRTETSSGDVWLYTYDAVGNLLEVDAPGVTGTITYIIDPRNRRVGKRVDGVMVQRFLYGDQLNPIAELDGAGALVSRFVYGTSDHAPDYMVRGGTTYRFLTDQNGNVVGLFNTTTNTMAQTREYDAYGRVVGGGTTEGGFSQPFGFAGGLYDEDTGLVRFGARDYRPEVGSWAAKDPLRFAAGDASLFAYVYSEPVNLVDVTGLKPGDWYISRRAAARAFLREAWAHQNTQNDQEALTHIKKRDGFWGGYTYEPPIWGKPGKNIPEASFPPVPDACVGTAHTHGKRWDTLPGGANRTKGFTGADLTTFQAWAVDHPDWKHWVASPWHWTEIYEWSDGDVTDIWGTLD